MIRIRHNIREDYFHVKYEDEIDAQQILDYLAGLFDDETLPDDLKILTDARESKYAFTMKGKKAIDKYLSENLKRFRSVRNAFIHASPRETALSVMLENTAISKKFAHRVFSTEKGALDWLLQK